VIRSNISAVLALLLLCCNGIYGMDPELSFDFGSIELSNQPDRINQPIESII